MAKKIRNFSIITLIIVGGIVGIKGSVHLLGHQTLPADVHIDGGVHCQCINHKLYFLIVSFP